MLQFLERCYPNLILSRREREEEVCGFIGLEETAVMEEVEQGTRQGEQEEVEENFSERAGGDGYFLLRPVGEFLFDLPARSAVGASRGLGQDFAAAVGTGSDRRLGRRSAGRIGAGPFADDGGAGGYFDFQSEANIATGPRCVKPDLAAS